MDWLLTLFDKLFCWVPRCIIIRSTHGGVKWRTNLFKAQDPDIIQLRPGLHWYWPLVSECQWIVTARQTVDVPTMSLLTQDGTSVVVSASVILKVNDVEAAIGRLNWDVDSTAIDLTQHVIFDAIRNRSFADLLSANEWRDEVTENSKQELRKFGVLVERVLVKDFDRSKTYRMLGETYNFLSDDEGE